jgi:hypothetical protein
LNLHSHYRNQALNLARLPIPPLRLAFSEHVASRILWSTRAFRQGWFADFQRLCPPIEREHLMKLIFRGDRGSFAMMLYAIKTD